MGRTFATRGLKWGGTISTGGLRLDSEFFSYPLSNRWDYAHDRRKNRPMSETAKRGLELLEMINGYVSVRNIGNAEFRRWIDELEKVLVEEFSKNDENDANDENDESRDEERMAQKEEINILSGMVTAYRDVIRMLRDKEK